MSRVLTTLALFLTLVFALPSNVVAQRRNYSTDWSEAGRSGQLYYLGGFQEGSFGLLMVQWAAKGDVVDIAFADAMAILSAPQRAALVAAVRKYHSETDIEKYGTAVVADVMSSLYRDPANSFIPWNSMIRVAVLRLSGASAKEVEDWLALLRRAADRQEDARTRR